MGKDSADILPHPGQGYVTLSPAWGIFLSPLSLRAIGAAIQIIRNRPLFTGLRHCVRNDKGDEVPGKLNTLVIASKRSARGNPVIKFANRDYVLYNNYCGGGFATAGLTTPSNALCIRKVKNTPTRGWGTVNILNKQCYTFDSSQPPTTRIFPVVLFMKKRKHHDHKAKATHPRRTVQMYR